ncbi:hypothetical protein N7468_001623 [Penicillium chermesinum]|uniref:PLAC8-domain-containing protein n=1 Tax=Penicillium chermesinum TaxID=63820 RepID=A0A9W9TWY2_9EURO|nr:uncharacterized protein N7468_001623 [Penicillium chermesinum]KAJ5246640.1 hypothetical protein N7468_001623 [Penicillium chermesinum]
MDRSLQLNTQAQPSHNRRYSFTETPLDKSPSPEHQYQFSSPTSSIATPNMNASPASHHHPVEFRRETWSQSPQNQYISNEKERHLQEEGLIPTYSKYPPPEQHPALYAPIDDAIEQRHPTSQAEPLQPQPPNSPGPIPLKINPDVPNRSDTITVAPDSNPLQSPKIPYFPPPAAVRSFQAPTFEDLETFHQPGQISHPNQDVQGGAWNHGLCDFSNLGTCCLGLACPCILYGKTQYRLGMKSKKDDPTNMLGYKVCNGACTGMALLCGCQWHTESMAGLGQTV